jgi:t-SNARE complex subunit (syntaxin)
MQYMLVIGIGEMLDHIEFQVKSTADYVDDANIMLVEAVDLQKSLRKKQACCVLIVLIVIGK